ncbi:MAG: hypothetical protein V7K47_16065 [Nostoc sp.]
MNQKKYSQSVLESSVPQKLRLRLDAKSQIQNLEFGDRVTGIISIDSRRILNKSLTIH